MLNMSRIAVVFAALTGTTAPALAASSDCAQTPAEASPTKGETGYETPKSQPAERSAIVPAMPNNTQSAAPTAQQDGKPVLSETECAMQKTDPNAPPPKS